MLEHLKAVIWEEKPRVLDTFSIYCYRIGGVLLVQEPAGFGNTMVHVQGSVSGLADMLLNMPWEPQPDIRGGTLTQVMAAFQDWPAPAPGRPRGER